jgi:hypothetical protein
VTAWAPAGILSRIRELLGLTADDPEFPTSALDASLRRTRRQMLESARFLGLTGLHRLPKGALAARLLRTLQGMMGSAEDEPADGPHKFDLGRPTEKAVEVEQIPWGYGQDRVTAMVVDRERLFVYWEVTDEAIERARVGLGVPAGATPGSTCVSTTSPTASSTGPTPIATSITRSRDPTGNGSSSWSSRRPRRSSSAIAAPTSSAS